MIIRPIRLTDLDDFEKLAQSAAIGIINLPKNRAILQKKIEESIEAFAKKIDSPTNEKYIFVMENLETLEIGGTCSIFSQSGMSFPVYYYKIENSKLKYAPNQIQMLKAVSYTNDVSEIAALVLHRNFRKSGVGKLLSFSRFLFIAAFKERFRDSIFAEIRGVINEDNVCPFWEGLGRHFLDFEYDQLMKFIENGRGFIPDILPDYPIYLSLLPKHVIEVLGKPHEKSLAALSMLQSEGFIFENEVDIFDGGPRVKVLTSEIKTIKDSVLANVHAINEESLNTDQYILSNERIDFRATLSCIKIMKPDQIVIDKKTAYALEIAVGDKIRYILNE